MSHFLDALNGIAYTSGWPSHEHYRAPPWFIKACALPLLLLDLKRTSSDSFPLLWGAFKGIDALSQRYFGIYDCPRWGHVLDELLTIMRNRILPSQDRRLAASLALALAGATPCRAEFPEYKDVKGAIERCRIFTVQRQVLRLIEAGGFKPEDWPKDSPALVKIERAFMSMRQSLRLTRRDLSSPTGRTAAVALVFLPGSSGVVRVYGQERPLNPTLFRYLRIMYERAKKRQRTPMNYFIHNNGSVDVNAPHAIKRLRTNDPLFARLIELPKNRNGFSLSLRLTGE